MFKRTLQPRSPEKRSFPFRQPMSMSQAYAVVGTALGQTADQVRNIIPELSDVEGQVEFLPPKDSDGTAYLVPVGDFKALFDRPWFCSINIGSGHASVHDRVHEERNVSVNLKFTPDNLKFTPYEPLDPADAAKRLAEQLGLKESDILSKIPELATCKGKIVLYMGRSGSRPRIVVLPDYDDFPEEYLWVYTVYADTGEIINDTNKVNKSLGETSQITEESRDSAEDILGGWTFDVS